MITAGDREAFSHEVAALYRDDALAGELREAGAVVSVMGARGPGEAHRLLPRIVAKIRKTDPDLVHTQLVMSDVLGRAAVLLGRRRPVLCTLQNRPYDSEAVHTELPAGWRGRLLRGADRWLGVGTRTRYVAVSEAVRSSYVRELGIAKDRVEVVYNSVDLGKFRRRRPPPSERRERRASLGLPDAPLVLNVARHTRQKGLLHLVEAMATAELGSSGAHLLLVGAGPETDAIRERVAALGLDDALSILGHRSDVRELMEICDLFVLPSIYEGLPLALLEAMATGLPVVASDLPEIREATTENGARLVPPGQPLLLAQALADLLSHPGASAVLSNEARLQVEARFDLHKNVMRFEAIARDMALRSDRRP